MSMMIMMKISSPIYLTHTNKNLQCIVKQFRNINNVLISKNGTILFKPIHRISDKAD